MPPRTKWIVISTVLQLALVVGAVALQKLAVIPIAGTILPFVIGVLYARDAKLSWRDAALTGGIAGGLGAFIGACVEVALAKEPEWIMTLVLATSVSFVAAAVGGSIGHALLGRKHA